MKVTYKLGVVAHAFYPNFQEAKAQVHLWVRGQPCLRSEFQDQQGNVERSYLNK